MKAFDELWNFTDTIPGSFTRLSGEKLWEYALGVPDKGVVIEVGVDQGRSASILLESAKLTNAFVHLIDSWESILVDNRIKVEAMCRARFEAARYFIFQEKSVAASEMFTPEGTDLIHIDAHHHDDVTDGGPNLDCIMWLPKLKPGGVACFHDYDSTFHDVKKAVDKYTAGWEDLGAWDSLAIRRKPGK
jgi:hypothetical protein